MGACGCDGDCKNCIDKRECREQWLFEKDLDTQEKGEWKYLKR